MIDKAMKGSEDGSTLRAVPVAVLVVVFAQLVGFGYLGGQMREMIRQNAKEIARLHTIVSQRDPLIQNNNKELAVISERLENIEETLNRLEHGGSTTSARGTSE